MDNKRLKIVYLTPALYMAGGVERVLTLKANKVLCNVHRFKMDLIAQRWKTLFDEVCR
jgi:effector-binding domain-containing protein